MSEQNKFQKCVKCNSKVETLFCSTCGHPQKLKRINSQFILSEIGSVFNFQKGILFTIRELLIRPGASVRKYIHEDRKLLVKPISFIILCSLAYSVLQRYLQFEDGYMNYSGFDWGGSAISFIVNWISNNYGFANVLMAFFMALWIKLFFRKYDYNYFEILILLYFVLGIQMLMGAIFGIAEHFSGVENLLDNCILVAVLFVCWGIARFFDGRKVLNYFKAGVCYMLGIFSFNFSAVAFGALLDFVFNLF
ncbi:MAG: DUF3667 domain-containing protein [Saprospiraceae bacterium]